MDEPSQEVETNLVDLSEVSLGMLRASDPDTLADSAARLLHQIARHRLNLGGGGEPTRVD